MRFFITLGLIAISSFSFGQPFQDYQLRLEPVWSRVADALGEAGSVESAEFSKDGKYIVSGTKYDNSVVMWRTSDGAELWRQYTAQEVERVGFSPDGSMVAACSEDFLVTVYNAMNGEVLQKIKHTQGIDGLTWSNSGKYLVTGEELIRDEDGNETGVIRVFDMPRGKLLTTLPFGSTTNELFFSSDDGYLLAVGHKAVKVFNTSDWSVARTLTPGYEVKFITGVFSPDDRYVIAAGNSDQNKGNIYLWEWQSGKLVKKFNHTGKKVESITWHPNGQYICHAGHTPYIHVYRITDILDYKNDNIRSAATIWASDHAEYLDFNEDGSFLVSSHQNGLIKLWAWMGEDPDLNSNRHKQVKKTQGNPNN